MTSKKLIKMLQKSLLVPLYKFKNTINFYEISIKTKILKKKILLTFYKKLKIHLMTWNQKALKKNLTVFQISWKKNCFKKRFMNQTKKKCESKSIFKTIKKILIIINKLKILKLRKLIYVKRKMFKMKILMNKLRLNIN